MSRLHWVVLSNFTSFQFLNHFGNFWLLFCFQIYDAEEWINKFCTKDFKAPCMFCFYSKWFSGEIFTSLLSQKATVIKGLLLIITFFYFCNIPNVACSFPVLCQKKFKNPESSTWSRFRWFHCIYNVF